MKMHPSAGKNIVFSDVNMLPYTVHDDSHAFLDLKHKVILFIVTVSGIFYVKTDGSVCFL